MKIREKEAEVTIKGEARIITYKAGTNKILRKTKWHPNRVVSSAGHGRNIIIQRLVGNNTHSLNITHLDIGTDGTPPTDADQSLGNAVLRSPVDFATSSTNQATFRFFYPDVDLPEDEYKEIGGYIDGSSTLGTGQLWNRLLFTTPYNKADGEDTTIEVRFTVSI